MNRKVLATLLHDVEARPEVACIVRHDLTHVEGVGPTWEDALVNFRREQTAFFAEIHRPEHGAMMPTGCLDCRALVAGRNTMAALEDMSLATPYRKA